MTNSEFLKKLGEYESDKKKVSKLEKIYGYKIPEIIGRIVSFASKPIFLEGYRILSFGEVCEADDGLNVKFSEKKIIPLIDCGDNDFIVYHCKVGEWSKFNIIDECAFKKKSSLDELLK